MKIKIYKNRAASAAAGQKKQQGHAQTIKGQNQTVEFAILMLEVIIYFCVVLYKYTKAEMSDMHLTYAMAHGNA